jgi:hypothetical protein
MLIQSFSLDSYGAEFPENPPLKGRSWLITAGFARINFWDRETKK